MVPPPLRAAMLAAAIRSRCPVCPQCGQWKLRPAGLGTRRLQAGQVDDVPQSADEVADPPVPDTLVVAPPRSKVQDTARVTDRQCPGPLLHRPGHHCPGGFVLGLADPPLVPGFGGALRAAVLPPPPRPPLPRLRGARGGGAGTGPSLRRFAVENQASE
jgi:hypothetical protein